MKNYEAYKMTANQVIKSWCEPDLATSVVPDNLPPYVDVSGILQRLPIQAKQEMQLKPLPKRAKRCTMYWLSA